MVLVDGKPRDLHKRPLEGCAPAGEHAKVARALDPVAVPAGALPGLAIPGLPGLPAPHGLLGLPLGALPPPGAAAAQGLPGLLAPHGMVALPLAAPAPAQAGLPVVPAAPGVPSVNPLAMGQFDMLAHLAACARMSAAMAEAQGPTAGTAEPQATEHVAFDKEALALLAREASGLAASGGSPEGCAPRLPPAALALQAALAEAAPAAQAPAAGALGALALPPGRGAAEASGLPLVPPAVQAPAPPQRADAAPAAAVATDTAGAAPAAAPPAPPACGQRAGPAPSPLSAPKAEGQAAPEVVALAPEPPAVAPEAARSRGGDSGSVATLLQQVKHNVARGHGPRGSARAPAAVAPAPLGAVTVAGAGRPPAPSLLEGLARRLARAEECAGARRQLEEDIVAALPRLDPPGVAELVAGVHRAEWLRSPGLLGRVAQALQPGIARLRSTHMTRVLSALAAWASAPPAGGGGAGGAAAAEDVRALFASASAELAARVADMVPRDLSHAATALVSVGLAEEHLLANLARAGAARADRFAAEELASLTDAVHRAGFFHAPLLEALARRLREAAPEVPARELLRGMRALAVASARDAELARAVGRALRAQGGGLAPDELCSMAWAFCALGFYHDGMFRAVFRAAEDSPVMSSDALCQLHEVHLSLKAFRKDSYAGFELAAKAASKLRGHYRKHRGGTLRAPRPDEQSDKVLKEIVETLRTVVSCTVAMQYQTDLGLSVDTAVLRRKGSKVVAVVEVDGARTALRPLEASAVPSGRTQGPVQLKRQILQRHGFRIAVVSEDLWRSLDGRERRDLLRELLRACGVSPGRLR